jgi:hypothetical protein
MDVYNKSVFINCPFDKSFEPLLQTLIFTIIYLDYVPRITLERSDSGETRFSKICDIISACKFSIHDLSRIKAKRRGEYFRLNMPFELGLDIGARVFNQVKHKQKKCLILEEEPFRFQAAISDISNSDIKHHNNDPIKLIKSVRDFFAENGLKHTPGFKQIYKKYLDFSADFFDKRTNEGYTKTEIYSMTIKEMIDYMIEWKKTIERLERGINNYI